MTERRLDAWALAAGDATGWFEELYAAAAARVTMPWSRTGPHMLLAEWTRMHRREGRAGGDRGWLRLGTGAEHVARLSFDTVAFHVFAHAVAVADHSRRGRGTG